MASHATNGEGNGSIPKGPVPAQPSAKTFSGAKMPEGVRKSVGNTDDGTPRRAPQPKAWMSNINPITQQPNNNSQSNGTLTNAKTPMQRSMNPQDSNVSDRNANDRQVWALGNILGLLGNITTKGGETFSGVFAGATTQINEPSVLFKMVRKVSNQSREGANGLNDTLGDYIGAGSDYSMLFSMADIIDITVADVATISSPNPQNGAGQGFRIDSDISSGFAPRERDLKRWEPPSEHDVDISQEAVGEWDQFAANEKFGGKSTYHEELYTTAIDRSGPLYRMREIEAERKAREIEADMSSNVHVREERGLELDGDGLDEEERYSGVRRNGQDYPPLQSNLPNKYMPPARRLPSNKLATSGAVDPAIISAQIARPAESKRSGDVQQTAKVSDVPKENVPGKSTQSSITEQPPKPALPHAPSKIETQKGTVGATATENVEANLLDSFRQFANMEKMKVQDNRRHRQSQDKAVRFNDLMKFAKNFKLLTPVPSDLVPILAKDKSKQDEIVEKARRNAETLAEVGATGKASVLTDQKGHRPLAVVQREGDDIASTNDLQTTQGRSGQTAQLTQNLKDRSQATNVPSQAARNQQGLLSHRLADSHRLHKSAMQPVSIPNPLPIQEPRQQPTRSGASGSGLSSPHKAGGIQSPTSSTSARFNVKAMEFRPNPAASTFKPTNDPSMASTPRTDANTRSGSRAPTPSDFFGDRKLASLAERPSILAHFNPLKHLKEEAEKDELAKKWVSNGGIKPAYKTTPTWTIPNEDPEKDKSYKDMFDKARPSGGHTATPQHSPPVNTNLAHQHQLPQYLQNGPQGIPQVQTPLQVPHQMPAQPQHYNPSPHHYDDHHMRPSASSSSVYPAPSPRMQNNSVAYPSPMNHPAQLAYNQPMHQYVMGTHGPQQAGFRQFSGTPQMIAAQGPHLAPMMVQQPSAGGYMVHPQPIAMPFNPQMAMYPGAAPQPYGVPPGSSSGYPSPSRGAPMMMHQGSHQGQPVYMTPTQYGQPVYAQQPPAHMTPMRGGFASPQPHYSQSPYQQHHYPHQAHRTPSSGYAQLPQVHHPHMVPQPVPPPTGPMELGEEPK